MGGLARRVSYVKAFKHRSNLEVPALFVDAGNLFTDDRYTATGMPPDVMAKNKWVVKAYHDFQNDAANISYSDLPYISDLLKKDGFDDRVKEFPFIKRIVSANIHPADDTRNEPVPYVIREITLKRNSPGKKIRIGITGFTDGRPTGPNMKEWAYGGMKIEDPFEAAKRVLPELKQKSDIVIVLAYMPQELAQRLASEHAEIDTIIGAKMVNDTVQAQHFNRATVTYAYNQTKYIGELRYYVNSSGTVENQVTRFAGLDSFIPDDPKAVDQVTAAHTEFTNLQNQNAQQTKPPAADTNMLASAANSPFAGADSCTACHQEEHAIWEKSSHAHAMATLERKQQQFDNECVGCHVVGFQKGGFQSLVTTPQLANVQCESCHGPGKKHVESPGKGYGFMAVPAGCIECHTKPNSPDFEFASYWDKIKHGSKAQISKLN